VSGLRHTGLPPAAIEGIVQTLSRHAGVDAAILYGSRAKGTHRPGSDIDLTLTGKLDYDELLVIETELDALMLPYRIDLSLFDQLDNLELIEHIRRVGQTLYRRVPDL